MDVQEAYNAWADQYDTSLNRTRDLEGVVLRDTLKGLNVDTCLEIGCGTGKNTEWLVERSRKITSVDFSIKMLEKAQQKINNKAVRFIQADITVDWSFATDQYDLITFSLVLEHVENLDAILNKAAKVIRPGGHVYIGELHPFKQYTGTKARFDTENGQQIVTCFNHHVSDFTGAAENNGFQMITLKEYFDNDDRAGIPRIILLLLKKT